MLLLVHRPCACPCPCLVIDHLSLSLDEVLQPISIFSIPRFNYFVLFVALASFYLPIYAFSHIDQVCTSQGRKLNNPAIRSLFDSMLFARLSELGHHLTAPLADGASQGMLQIYYFLPQFMYYVIYLIYYWYYDIIYLLYEEEIY